MLNHKFIEHTADIKFQAFGRTIEEAFANSLIAMFSSMYEKKVERKYKHYVKIKGTDEKNLLYNFLEEFLFLFDSKGVFVSKVESIKIDREKMELECFVSGDVAKNYKIHTAIKAVTYNDMIIREEKGRWMIQVVLDV